MKRMKLFLTENEVEYLKQVMNNILIDLIIDKGNNMCSLNKRQLRALLNKIQEL